VHSRGYRVNLPGLEADRPPLSSVDIKKDWRYNSSPSIHLRGVSRDDVTFCTVPVTCSGLGWAGDSIEMELIET